MFHGDIIVRECVRSTLWVRFTALCIVVWSHAGDATPACLAADAPPLRAVDGLIHSAIERKEIPGAVLLVGRGKDVIYRRAYGNRSLVPTRDRMTVDTVFDLASLTKPVATAASVMVLVERGKIGIKQSISRFLPEFGSHGKDTITVEQLLLHRGGLIPDNPIADYLNGPEKAWEKICDLKLKSVPGAVFKYTDVGYIVLGKLVERVAGKPLNVFALEALFKPLGMTNTQFLPSRAFSQVDARVYAARAATTEKRDGRWLVGQVHDPRAHKLGGVAGHAGLFATVDDLAKFAQMFVTDGRGIAKQVVSTSTIATMTRGHWLPDGTGGRSYGWDVDTGFSSARGDRYPRGVSFGHTGFTGTSIWIDPISRTYVILLTNRVHPDGEGKTIQLRREIATVVARHFYDQTGGVSQSQSEQHPVVLTGIDVLKKEQFKTLMDQKIALVTNQTGVDRNGKRTIDLLHEAENVDFVRIFSPEHGLYGQLEGEVGNAVDMKTGVKVYSLYGKTRRPSETMLKGVDTIVFDIQDVGARFYTYITTLGYAMEAAAKHDKRVVVLDRPNPISPLGARGPLADKDKLSFIAYRPMPVTHGMTIGELAIMFNKVHGINCKLKVIKMQGWSRSMWFDRTGLRWVNPSPNMRNTTQALLYPGIGLLEACNVSVGRGTHQPFEQLGAPWIDGVKLAATLNGSEAMAGLRFVPITFVPDTSVYKGKPCGGVYIIVTDRVSVQPVRAGLAIAWQLNQLYGSKFEAKGLMRMMANSRVYQELLSQKSPGIEPAWETELRTFRTTSTAFVLYE